MSSWLRRLAVVGAALAALAGVGPAVAASAQPRPKPALNSATRHKLDQALAQARAGHFDRAFLLATQASDAQPGSDELATVREYLRQRATLAHLERAHGLQLARHTAAAAVEYRMALSFDSSNLDARQGLAALFPTAAPPPPLSTALRVKNAAPPVEISPSAGFRDFHLNTGLHSALASVAAAYGLRAYVANLVPDTPVRFTVAHASFAQAMAALHGMSGVDWIALDPHTLYFAQADQFRDAAPMALRTFYLPWVQDAVALNQIANVARSLLGIQEITVDAASRALSIRAQPLQLDAAEKLLLDLNHSPGQVLLEIKILELNSTAARDLGLSVPSQFTLFMLGPLLSQLQQSGNLSQSIFQLFEQGGLNAVLNSGALGQSALQAAQSISPLLQSPFVVFGGGATLMALSVPPLTANFNQTRGRVSSLETALLRSQSGQSAELKIGERYPVINASFSPISLSPAISQVIGSGGFVQPFPSFTYEDLGLDAKVTPELAASGDLRLQIEINVNALTGVSNNNIPILSSRHLITAVDLRDNQPVLLAGLLNQQEMTSLSGLPGLAQIPGFGRLFSTQTSQTSRDQLLLEVTPHVVQWPGRSSAALWLPASFPATGSATVLPQPVSPPGLIRPGRGGFGGGS